MQSLGQGTVHLCVLLAIAASYLADLKEGTRREDEPRFTVAFVLDLMNGYPPLLPEILYYVPDTPRIFGGGSTLSVDRTTALLCRGRHY